MTADQESTQKRPLAEEFDLAAAKCVTLLSTWHRYFDDSIDDFLGRFPFQDELSGVHPEFSHDILKLLQRKFF